MSEECKVEITDFMQHLCTTHSVFWNCGNACSRGDKTHREACPVARATTELRADNADLAKSLAATRETLNEERDRRLWLEQMYNDDVGGSESREGWDESWTKEEESRAALKSSQDDAKKGGGGGQPDERAMVSLPDGGLFLTQVGVPVNPAAPKEEKCERCGGRGEDIITTESWQKRIPCHACHGTGKKQAGGGE